MNPLLDEALNARQSSRFKEAMVLYRKALGRPGLGPEEKVEALLGLADVERIQGSFRESLLHYERAELLRKGHGPMTALDAKVGWALAARAVGRPLEALAILKKALSVYRAEMDRQGSAFTHWALGGTYRIAGDMKAGLRELRVALRLFQASRDAEGTAYVLCALGGIYRMLGRYGDSGKCYRAANRRMRARKDTFGTAYSYCGLGNVERMAGRHAKALPYYRKAERLYGRIGDRVSYAYTLWSIGTALKMTGKWQDARLAFAEADTLFRQTGDTRGRIYSLLGFAEVEWLDGRDSRGDAYWNKARRFADASDFDWEKLHVAALKGGKVTDLRTRYRRAGSSFYPKTLPVNWP